MADALDELRKTVALSCRILGRYSAAEEQQAFRTARRQSHDLAAADESGWGRYLWALDRDEIGMPS